MLSSARRSVEGAQSCVRLAANVTVPGVRLRITGAAAELRYSRVLANLRSGRDLDEVNDARLLRTKELHRHHAHVSGRSSAVSVVTRLLTHCSETTSEYSGCSEFTKAFDDVSEHNCRRRCSNLEQCRTSFGCAFTIRKDALEVERGRTHLVGDRRLLVTLTLLTVGMTLRLRSRASPCRS